MPSNGWNNSSLGEQSWKVLSAPIGLRCLNWPAEALTAVTELKSVSDIFSSQVTTVCDVSSIYW